MIQHPVVIAKFWLDFVEPHNAVPCCCVKSNMVAKEIIFYKENVIVDIAKSSE